MIRTLFAVLWTIIHTFRINSSTEESLTACFFHTEHKLSNSDDVDILKLRFIQYDTYYNGCFHLKQKKNEINICTPLIVIKKHHCNLNSWFERYLRFYEQSFTLSGLIPVQKSPLQRVFFTQNTNYLILMMWIYSNCASYNMIHTTMV